MTRTYKLTTLRDVYEQVPADKLALCMREIAEGMEQAKALEALMNCSAATLAPGASVTTLWPDSCTWIDDGKTDTTIGVTDAATGEVAFTVATSGYARVVDFPDASGLTWDDDSPTAAIAPQRGDGHDVLTVSAGSPKPPAWARDDCA